MMMMMIFFLDCNTSILNFRFFLLFSHRLTNDVSKEDIKLILGRHFVVRFGEEKSRCLLKILVILHSLSSFPECILMSCTHI